MSINDDCTLGVKNEQRIIALEKAIEKTQSMIFWLTTSSFAILAGLIISLVLMLADRHN